METYQCGWSIEITKLLTFENQKRPCENPQENAIFLYMYFRVFDVYVESTDQWSINASTYYRERLLQLVPVPV